MRFSGIYNESADVEKTAYAPFGQSEWDVISANTQSLLSSRSRITVIKEKIFWNLS